jgi:hypothetical protein
VFHFDRSSISFLFELLTTITNLRAVKSWNNLIFISLVAPFMTLDSPAVPSGMSGGKIDE